MRVKNFLVDERAIVMDELERFLCIQGISYVKVENEIHCQDLILKFYEFEEYLQSDALLHQMTEGSMDILSIDLDAISSNLENIARKPYPLLESNNLENIASKPYPLLKSNKRKMLHQENKQQIQKIKK